MRVLVTGATGFIGRHLILAMKDDHEVIALCRRRGEHFPDEVEVRTVPQIDSRTDWAGLLTDVDVVIHLAARVHVMKEASPDPLEDFREVNTRGTLRLAQACAQQGVRRFIFMSSIKVNGEETHEEPFRDVDAANPVDAYGQSKAEAESGLQTIARQGGIELVILRPPVVYGTGVKGNVSRLIRLIRTRLPHPLGAINNRRTMISIDNLVQWVLAAVRNPRLPQLPVLVGDVEALSTPQLIQALAAGMGTRVALIPVPLRILRAVGTILGQRATFHRLTTNLAIDPSIESYPEVGPLLRSAGDELRALGAEEARTEAP